VSRVCHELAIGRVVDGLDAYDLCFEPMLLLGQEPQKLQLCSRWSYHQDLVGLAKHRCDTSKEVSCVARVRMLGGRVLGVPMKVMLRRSDGLCLKLFCVDAKDARFLMIEPHDGLMSLHGGLESKARAKVRVGTLLAFASWMSLSPTLRAIMSGKVLRRSSSTASLACA